VKAKMMERRLAYIVAVVSAIVIAWSYGKRETVSEDKSLKFVPMQSPKIKTGVIAYAFPDLKHSVDSRKVKRSNGRNRIL
jgi:hypothetical protein